MFDRAEKESKAGARVEQKARRSEIRMNVPLVEEKEEERRRAQTTREARQWEIWMAGDG